MYQMVIPRTKLTDSSLLAFGRLSVEYHATVTSNETDAIIIFRTERVNGEDIGGVERALQARTILESLIPLASKYDQFPPREEE